MRPFKFLLFIGLLILSGRSTVLMAQDRKDCEVKARIDVESTPGKPGQKQAVVKLEDGTSPIKYLFFEELSGRLLQKDFAKNTVGELKRGSYYCIIVDDKGCTKKIQFQIQ